MDTCLAAKVALEYFLGELRGRRIVLSESVDTKKIRFWVSPNNGSIAGANPSNGSEENTPLWGRWSGSEPIIVPPPSLSAMQTFLKTTLRSATECAAARQSAVDRGVLFKAPFEHPKTRGLFDFTYATLTMPVVSPDGREAIIYADTLSGPLAAGGRLILLRRNGNGDWEVAAEHGLWVS